MDTYLDSMGSDITVLEEKPNIILGLVIFYLIAYCFHFLLECNK
jgi:hypothetical protein